MASDRIENLLNQIGGALAEDTAYALDGTLLYARVASNWSAQAIFKDRGNAVLYRLPTGNLDDLLLDLWEEEEAGKRWAEMAYLIRDGRFTVTYIYADEIDPEEDPFVRRARIVARYFGDKPILYPPLPTGDNVQHFDL